AIGANDLHLCLDELSPRRLQHPVLHPLGGSRRVLKPYALPEGATYHLLAATIGKGERRAVRLEHGPVGGKHADVHTRPIVDGPQLTLRMTHRPGRLLALRHIGNHDEHVRVALPGALEPPRAELQDAATLPRRLAFNFQ